MKCKTRVFRSWGESPTRRQGKLPKHSKSKLWKKFLSFFCDWKVYLRGSRELSCENLCVPLTTGPFTRDQIAKINTWARGCSMRLGWPTTESPKQGNTVFFFFNFSVFVKTKYFPKTPKTLKKIFFLNQQRLSMWKHILTNTITQMNMAFIEHKLVCCVWISTMR